MTIRTEREHIRNGTKRTIRYVVQICRDGRTVTVATFERRPGQAPTAARRQALACTLRLANGLGCSALAAI